MRAARDTLSRPRTFGMLSSAISRARPVGGAASLSTRGPQSMSKKTWLSAYPPGVPAEIDADKYSSLVDLAERAFERYRDRPAFTNRGATLTFADVDRLSRDFAAYLQAVPGIEPGDRVAIMMPNLLQTPVAVFGALRAGMTVVNVNPLYTVREL